MEKKYISGENMKSAQKIVKDWLGRIKIYKVEKTNYLILTYEGLDDKRKLNFKRQI